MDEEKTNKPYELAYFLKTGLSQEGISSWKEKMSTLIKDIGGETDEALDLQDKKLAYPIKKAAHGLFGIIKFKTLPEKIKALDKKLRLEDELLRFLIVVDEEKERPRISKPARVRPVRIEKPEAKIEKEEEKPLKEVKPKGEKPPTKPKEEKKIELEELDKKLEEILGQ